MKFENCLFSRNKAVRHGGEIALQTTQTVEIIGCTFEENVANYKPPSSLELLSKNYYDQKSEGRGGAIYINPSFTDNTNKAAKMISVKIERCTFKSNSAFDGFAIYIEGDDDGTTFAINENKFINNNDGTDNSIKRGVILTEINFIFDESSNTFEIPSRYKIFPYIFVDHDARTPSPSPMATTINVTTSESDCNPKCYFVSDEQPNVYMPPVKEFYDIKNETASGSAIYIENAGLTVVDTNFTKCRSPNNGGGAIYVDTEIESVNHPITIENSFFKECKSSYGGTVYIRSKYECSPVTIRNCKFESNEALSKNKRDNLFGGSAVYLNVREGNIINCAFNRNIGKGGAVKLINEFEDSKSSLLQSLLSKNLVLIS